MRLNRDGANNGKMRIEVFLPAEIHQKAFSPALLTVNKVGGGDSKAKGKIRKEGLREKKLTSSCQTRGNIVYALAPVN